jgi:hypothetical protein
MIKLGDTPSGLRCELSRTENLQGEPQTPGRVHPEGRILHFSRGWLDTTYYC